MNLNTYKNFEERNGNADQEITVRRVYKEVILFEGKIKDVSKELLAEEVIMLSGVKSEKPVYILQGK